MHSSSLASSCAAAVVGAEGAVVPAVQQGVQVHQAQERAEDAAMLLQALAAAAEGGQDSAAQERLQQAASSQLQMASVKDLQGQQPVSWGAHHALHVLCV